MELEQLLRTLSEFGVSEYECNGMRIQFSGKPRPVQTGADIDPDDFEVQYSEMQIIGDEE